LTSSRPPSAVLVERPDRQVAARIAGAAFAGDDQNIPLSTRPFNARLSERSTDGRSLSPASGSPPCSTDVGEAQRPKLGFKGPREHFLDDDLQLAQAARLTVLR
jgi:hypothetical protein